MTTIEVVVFVWLAILTLWVFGLRFVLRWLIGLLKDAGVLVEVEPESQKKKPDNPTYVTPSDLDDPKNNPFLQAGIRAVQASKKRREEDNKSE